MPSLSARRAWIEMFLLAVMLCLLIVALRKESVDRNIQFRKLLYPGRTVALRKESVDRNFHIRYTASALPVALRKESVDRNNGPAPLTSRAETSLSARRAWIEMFDFPVVPVELTSRSPQGERG